MHHSFQTVFIMSIMINGSVHNPFQSTMFLIPPDGSCHQVYLPPEYLLDPCDPGIVHSEYNIAVIIPNTEQC